MPLRAAAMLPMFTLRRLLLRAVSRYAMRFAACHAIRACRCRHADSGYRCFDAMIARHRATLSHCGADARHADAAR